MTPLEPWEIEELLALVRAGRATLEQGGSRAGTALRGHPDGTFTVEVHDEGASWTVPSSEAEARAALVGAPDAARLAAYRAVRRALAGPFLAGDDAAARTVIAAAARFGGPQPADALLLALLDPDAGPDPAIDAALRREIEGSTFWHPVLGAAGWERSPAAGARGIALLDAALARIGPPAPPAAEAARAAFRALIPG